MRFDTRSTLDRKTSERREEIEDRTRTASGEEAEERREGRKVRNISEKGIEGGKVKKSGNDGIERNQKSWKFGPT